MLSKDRSEALYGARAVLPLALGVAAYGLAFGLLSSEAGFSSLETGLMSTLVFAGSAQIVAVERLAAGAGVAAALIAGVALNLRLLLITASLRDLFAGRPWWQKVLGAHFSTDENWALTIARRSQQPGGGFWFLIGTGGGLLAAWVFSTTLGVELAAHIPNPETYGADFAFTAAFIAISSSLWRSRADAQPWLAAVTVVILVSYFELFDTSWAIVLGGITGSVVAGLTHHD